MEQSIKTEQAPSTGQNHANRDGARAGGAPEARRAPSGEASAPPRPSPVTQIADGVWQAESSVRLPGGARLPARASIFRLEDKKLLVYSPVELSRDLPDALEEIGEVKFLVAPNAFHHLYLAAWQERFPHAVTYGPKRLRDRRPKISLDEIIDGSMQQPFGPSIDVEVIGGAPKLDEIAIYHRPSRTLALADLLFNIREAKRPMRWILRAMGTYGRAAPSRLTRLVISDRAAYRRSVERLRELDLARLMVAHGEVLEGQDAAVALSRVAPR